MARPTQTTMPPAECQLDVRHFWNENEMCEDHRTFFQPLDSRLNHRLPSSWHTYFAFTRPFNPRHPGQAVCCLDKLSLYASKFTPPALTSKGLEGSCEGFQQGIAMSAFSYSAKTASGELKSTAWKSQGLGTLLSREVEDLEMLQMQMQTVRMLREEQIPVHLSKIKATSGPRKKVAEKTKERRQAVNQDPNKALKEHYGGPPLQDRGFNRFLRNNNGCPVAFKAL